MIFIIVGFVARLTLNTSACTSIQANRQNRKKDVDYVDKVQLRATRNVKCIKAFGRNATNSSNYVNREVLESLGIQASSKNKNADRKKSAVMQLSAKQEMAVAQIDWLITTMRKGSQRTYKR